MAGRPRLLKVFMVWQPVFLLLALIAGLVGSFADVDPLYAAWYLNNAEDYDDWEASCSDDWYSDFNTFATFGLIFRWVLYLIFVAIISHMTWTAHQTRKYLMKPVAPAGTAMPQVVVATPAVATAMAATPAGSDPKKPDA